MRSKLLYLFSGVLLAAVVLLGAGLLRGQSATYSGPKWEYSIVAPVIDYQNPKQPIATLAINGAKVDFIGTVPDLFSKLGSEGWEYVAGSGITPYIFKRSLP